MFETIPLSDKIDKKRLQKKKERQKKKKTERKEKKDIPSETSFIVVHSIIFLLHSQ